MPTSTAGFPSVSGPPLSPWQVAAVGLTAHSSTAEFDSPTAERQASLLSAISEAATSLPLGCALAEPSSLPYPLTLSGVPAAGVAPVATSGIGCTVLEGVSGSFSVS